MIVCWINCSIGGIRSKNGRRASHRGTGAQRKSIFSENSRQNVISMQ
jgi:hypothetical protein